MLNHRIVHQVNSLTIEDLDLALKITKTLKSDLIPNHPKDAELLGKVLVVETELEKINNQLKRESSQFVKVRNFFVTALKEHFRKKNERLMEIDNEPINKSTPERIYLTETMRKLLAEQFNSSSQEPISIRKNSLTTNTKIHWTELLSKPKQSPTDHQKTDDVGRNNEIIALKGEVSRIKSLNEELKAHNEKLKASVDKLTINWNTASNELHSAKQNNANLQAEINNLTKINRKLSSQTKNGLSFISYAFIGIFISILGGSTAFFYHLGKDAGYSKFDLEKQRLYEDNQSLTDEVRKAKEELNLHKK